MGMGRQERWILNNLSEIAPASICTVGACMEYIADSVRTPPRWMGAVGLEWLFRLGENPQRFWHRYLVEPWPVLFHFFSHTLRRSD
jgi:N-acetylglucosaminyldiphosphoundecaprenol N-acetyl-beta-D-mannosaminyltransferase